MVKATIEDVAVEAGVSVATVDRVLAVVNHDARAADVQAGWRVERTGGRLRVERPS